MNTSRVSVNQLRQLEAGAWQHLLQDAVPSEDVVEVTEARKPARAVNRYLLRFDGYHEAVPFIGKKTNRNEARFYRDLASRVRRLVPHCWVHHVSADWSWLLLADVPDHRPAASWTSDDVEKVLALLASFHGTFWKENLTDAYPWLQDALAFPPDTYEAYRHLDAWHYWDRVAGGGRALSAHALHSAGELAPILIRAAAGLEVMRRLGGWPGIFDRRHAAAIDELLDDPVPVLQPLRELPVTLLHGDLSLHHWRLSLFDDRRLLDWRKVKVGPALWDLVDFLEQVEQIRRRRPAARRLPSEETMIDSYLLRLHVGLPQFDARAMRQSLPAALTLHVLTTWLPRFADWFQPFLGSPLTWQSLHQMDDYQLARVGYGRLAGIRGYLSDLFVRFWHASRAL